MKENILKQLKEKRMRRAQRLDSFYEELKYIHKTHFCDWRFGQLCSNFFGYLMSAHQVDLFYPEEDKMMEYIREYAEKFGTKMT